MLSKFGKTLRKLRIDHSRTLGQLGNDIGVSAAFLSALERGKSVPGDLVGKIASAMNLSSQERLELQQAADAQVKEVALKIDTRSEATRELAVAFARSFESMSDEEIRRILEPLKQQA
ncbi:helix-turn-helix transcriptional regulator [Pseudoxanthomonas sp.]|jgi:Helix-turn-helix.|uniref:helix-turn-helix domain-containing protein n=1 Tax=Pseudoxanthomonas sp. TaxID=1871049 RepID=UPI002FDF9252